MKTKLQLLMAGMLLATIGTGLGQPNITNQPQPCTNLVGTTATFTVGVTGTEPLAYQWQKADSAGAATDLVGRTDSALVLTNVQTSHAGDYRVVVTNIQGTVTSDFAHLTVPIPPFISRQPTNWLVVSIGASVTNSVGASGPPTLIYQWCFNGAPLPGQTKNSIILTNLQLSAAGDYTAVVTNLGGSVTSRVVTLTVDATFVKITTGAIVTDVEASVGVSWCDYDGDGFQDLFVVNGFDYRSAKNSLYHNNGNGTFTKITTNALSATSNWWICGVWADVDNDGDPDLYAGSATTGCQGVFYRNEGGGRFTAVSIVPTQDAAGRDSRIVAWGDYDLDGWVDLFMPGITRPGNNHLFRNLGDLKFKSMTAAEVGDVVAPAVSDSGVKATWIDWDGDGHLDISLWQDSGFALYLNSGSGFFTRTFTGSIANVTNLGGPPSWADVDNDGYFDVFIPRPNVDGINALHHNLGGTNFVEVTQAAGLNRPMNTIAGIWGDYDNDGNLDLFVMNPLNWLTPILRSANMLYRGNGDGTFTEVDVGSPIWEGSDDWEACWVDYDNDGFLDLFIAAGGYSPEVNYLYRNNLPATGNTNHWLKLSLIGKASNASGIGAKVRVTANIRGQTVTQLRAIDAPGGEGSNQGLLAHFGLADATNVTTLRIEWPSGIVQELQNVTNNQFLKVVECQGYAGLCPSFAGATRQTNGLQISITEPAAGARYVLEGSADLLSWTKLMAKTSAGGTAQYTDTSAANNTKRFYRVVVP